MNPPALGAATPAGSQPAASQPASAGLILSGVRIVFPHGKRPFPQQLAVMGRVITAADRMEHCLLESPTGTGKTLALLCSSLAWQKANYEKANKTYQIALDAHQKRSLEYQSALEAHKQRASQPDVPFPPPPPDIGPAPQPTRIFFTSRTHSQLTQAMAALKTCPPEVLRGPRNGALRVVVLASRDQTCVNPKVASLRGGELNDACRELLSTQRKEKGRQPQQPQLFAGLSKFPPNQTECSFGDNKAALKSAFDTQICDVEDLVKQGKLHAACPYMASRQALPMADLVFAPYNYLVDPSIRKSMQLDELVRGAIVIVDEAHNIEGVARDAASFEKGSEALGHALGEFKALARDGPSELQPVGRAVEGLLHRMLGWVERSAAKPGFMTGAQALQSWAQDGLNVNEEAVQDLADQRKEMDDWIYKMHGDDKSLGKWVSSGNVNLVDQLLLVLAYLTARAGTFARDYRVAATQELRAAAPGKRRPGGGGGKIEFTLNIWCLNPEVACRTLITEPSRARSLILTSGTLSPLPALASELGVEFKHQLELMHVADVAAQVYARVLSSCDGEALDSSYANAERFSYQDAVGRAVLGCAKGVPGGVLVFASSYAMLDRLRQRWEATGLWEQLEAAKPISVETRGSGEEFDRAVQKFRLDAANESGALFFAVFRGKLSEGIDFADDAARAVIVLGLPFPNTKDQKVALKKAYQDDRLRAFKSAQPGALAGIPPPLSGNEWYVQQAYRALNQALGRCIRHKDDYGAVLFLDQRFADPRVVAGLSKWMRGAVRLAPSVAFVQQEKADFFRARAQVFDALKKQKLLAMQAPPLAQAPGVSQVASGSQASVSQLARPASAVSAAAAAAAPGSGMDATQTHTSKHFKLADPAASAPLASGFSAKAPTFRDASDVIELCDSDSSPSATSDGEDDEDDFMPVETTNPNPRRMSPQVGAFVPVHFVDRDSPVHAAAAPAAAIAPTAATPPAPRAKRTSARTIQRSLPQLPY